MKERILLKELSEGKLSSFKLLKDTLLGFCKTPQELLDFFIEAVENKEPNEDLFFIFYASIAAAEELEKFDHCCVKCTTLEGYKFMFPALDYLDKKNPELATMILKKAYKETQGEGGVR